MWLYDRMAQNRVVVLLDIMRPMQCSFGHYVASAVQLVLVLSRTKSHCSFMQFGFEDYATYAVLDLMNCSLGFGPELYKTAVRFYVVDAVQ